jgi:hypothetical protein
MTGAEVRRSYVVDALRELLPVYGFTLVNPVVPLMQAEHESGLFTSNLCVNHNNCYGMMYPSVRPTTADGMVQGGFAAYPSLRACVEDYLIRQTVFHIPNTADPATYIAATVASGYAEDPNYANAWGDLVAAALVDGGIDDGGGVAVDAGGTGSLVAGLVTAAAVALVLTRS